MSKTLSSILMKCLKPSSGAVYDLRKFGFKTGPAFSFGKGKGDRFKEVGFLPDIGSNDD